MTILWNNVGQRGTEYIVNSFKVLKDAAVPNHCGSMNNWDSFSQHLRQGTTPTEDHYLENKLYFYPSKTESIVTKSKKSTVNLSVDTNLIHELKEESKTKSQGLNAHINSILIKHVVFFRHAFAEEAVMFPQEMWASILEIIDKKTIVDIMEQKGTPTVISNFSHNNIPFTIGNIIKYCFEGIALWTGCYSSFDHYKADNGEICLIFDHKFNKKWSEILAEVFSDMVEKMVNQKSTSVIDTNTLVLRVKEPQFEQ